MIARGIRSLLSASETPRTMSGVSKLLKPYECEIGMTPKFKSRGLMPIVSQMFSQSASNCSLRKRTARGAAVVPDVSFNSEGRSLPQSFALISVVAAAVAGGRIWTSLPPATAAATTRPISNALCFCSSLIVCSSGRTTSCLRRHARNNDGQSG